MIKTVVSVDMVGYSSIAREIEENVGADAVAKLNGQIQSFIDAGLAAVSGDRPRNVLNTTGDGAILLFDRAEDAHRFGKAFHNSAEEYNKAKTEQSAKRWFRIGVATGELARWESESLGKVEYAGIAIANSVRLEAKSGAGAILIDLPTWSRLTASLQTFYAAEEIVAGKRDENIPARRFQVLQQAPPAATVPAATPAKAILKLSHEDGLIFQDALSATPQFAAVPARQAIIGSALGGRSLSAQLNKALQFVHWDAAARVFAFELVQALNGRIVAPGVPALDLIAEALEDVTPVEHLEKLADLRLRIGWDSAA